MKSSSMRAATGYALTLAALALPAACAEDRADDGHDVDIDGRAEDAGESADIPADTPADQGSDLPPDGEQRLCTIDLIFAVDNSVSMQEEIAAFRLDVWPQFAEALRNASGGLSGEPFRVGVLDACPDPANYHVRGRSGACNFSSGRAWIESSSPSLVQEFQCVGDIWAEDSSCSGTNDDEQPASSAAASTEPPWTDPGERNEGFLREQALLIVIAITDEDERPVPATSADFVYQRLIVAKGNDPKKMVFLGIGGTGECEGPYGTAHDSATLRAITALFEAQERGIFWDLCAGSLQDGLTEAMSVIDVACEEMPMI